MHVGWNWRAVEWESLASLVAPNPTLLLMSSGIDCGGALAPSMCPLCDSPSSCDMVGIWVFELLDWCRWGALGRSASDSGPTCIDLWKGKVLGIFWLTELGLETSLWFSCDFGAPNVGSCSPMISLAMSSWSSKVLSAILDLGGLVRLWN